MTQLTRRLFTLAAAAGAGLALTRAARAQYPDAPPQPPYGGPPPPPYGGPPPPGYDPRYGGPRADDGQRFGPPREPGPPREFGQHGRDARFNREVLALQEERNRRVRDLQEQYNQRRINRYQLDAAVDQETRRMNDAIAQRRRESGF